MEKNTKNDDDDGQSWMMGGRYPVEYDAGNLMLDEIVSYMEGSIFVPVN